MNLKLMKGYEMKKIIMSLAIPVMAFLGVGGAVVSQTVPALASGVDNVQKYTTEANDGNTTDVMPMVQIIINVILGLIGLLAVVMIIIGGIMYTTSQGDPAKVKTAKDIILYSIIGLVVALLAFAVVNFVLQNVFNK